MNKPLAGKAPELGIWVEPRREVALGLNPGRICRVAGIQDRPG